MINIILSGCCGHMGKVISESALSDNEICIICGFDKVENPELRFPVYSNPEEYDGPADVIIDFSHPSATDALIAYAAKRKLPIVAATTGLSDEQIGKLNDLSKTVPVFRSANMSLGVNLMVKLIKKAAEILYGNFDIEIIEKHHNQKIDAPSGTALMLADAVKESVDSSMVYTYDRHSERRKRDGKEIGIHSIRGGTIVGEHEVIFAGNDEIVSVSHTALSKRVFAEGSLKAAKFIAGRKPGLYDMNSLIG